MKDIHNNLLESATKRRDSLTFEAETLDDMKKILDTQPGFIYADWCGDTDCELKN